MITTFSVIRLPSLARLRGLAAIMCALLVAGCSAVRLGYPGAPQLTWWWLDGYFDVDSANTPRVKASIEGWFEWHRQTQLPEYAAWLSSVERRLGEPVSAAQMCQWLDQGRRLLQPALDRALDAAVELVPVLGPAQLAHLEQRQAKQLAQARREYLEGDARARQEDAVDRMVQRAERFYGRLGEAQRRAVERSVAASPMDPARWLADRERRQRELLQTLRRWQSERPDRAQMRATLRQLAEQAEHGTDAGYRAYRQRVTEHQCRLAAELHQLATPAQRAKARQQFRTWEDDLRALAADRPAQAAMNPG